MTELQPWLVHDFPGPEPIASGEGRDQRREGVVDEGLRLVGIAHHVHDLLVPHQRPVPQTESHQHILRLGKGNVPVQGKWLSQLSRAIYVLSFH